MKWSKEQTKAHEDNFEKFRQAYVNDENKTTSINSIDDCRRRCVTLVEMLTPHKDLQISLSGTMGEIAHALPLSESEMPGFYFQEVSHLTIDCHRYLTEDKLPKDINGMNLYEQQDLVISREELIAYDKVVREIIGSELPFEVEVKGLAFGVDGLVAQAWYDDKRMVDLTERLGDKVREEAPFMDFVWGMVKNRVPLRVVNLARFIGREDKKATLDYIDSNKDREFGVFNMESVDLVLADHYLQQRNIRGLRNYIFNYNNFFK